ncbi:hypothetical protein A3E96_02375 [Candidatus Uhrbacteria bacterium RIFCSPHIGHO2_12_FULL_46_13]|nr:MAG: hypothetical protein A3E96_02375 [Candidatus Uhrbacteria bacterium RIFCSPHIGHO2_12_FULL_46_13]
MSFKPYHQKQTLLLPPSYEDVLGEGHDALILREFIADLDTSALEQSYANAHGGRAAYHPVMLFSVIIYAYMNRIFSSRAIAQRCRHDLGFMYLAGNDTPDFRTLARFRKEKGAQFVSLFAHVVTKAQDIGLVSFGTCSIDGTKVYANASREKNTTIAALEETIRACIEAAEALDVKEDAAYGDAEDDRDPQLKTKAGRAQKRHALREKQRIAEFRLRTVVTGTPNQRTARVNTTDPDSRLMRMKRGDYANGYNVQNVVENGVILSSSLFNTSADQATLIPSVHKLQQEHRAPQRLLADKGYSTEDNYTFCEQERIDAYIPIAQEQVVLDDYTYDAENDTYTHRDGRVYTFKQYARKRTGRGKRGRPSRSTMSRAEKRQLYRRVVYQHRDDVTKKRTQLIILPVWQRHVQKQKEKLATVLGKHHYKQRGHDVEGVFANIKKNFGFTTFSLRGFAGVTAEWNLVSLAHNMKKILAFAA